MPNDNATVKENEDFWDTYFDPTNGKELSSHSSDDNVVEFLTDSDISDDIDVDTNTDGEIDICMAKSKRSDNLDWCKCGQCSITTEIESFCCLESYVIRQKIEQNDANITCITMMPSFQTLIIDKESLELTRNVVGHQIKSEAIRTNYFKKDLNESLLRNLAYTNFYSYANGSGEIRGRGNRVVIPRCVVAKIRQAYPEKDNKYTGSKLYRNRETMYLY